MWTTLAWAQAVVVTPTVWQADVARPDGVGGPSVVWQAEQARFVAVVESPVTGPVGCTDAWALWTSTSEDGSVWSPLRKPAAAREALGPCGGRDPAVAARDDGVLVMAFTAWGPSGAEGIRVVVGESPTAQLVDTDLPDDLAQPSLARHDGRWRLVAVGTDGGVYVYGSDDLVTWEEDADPLLSGVASWAGDGLWSPALHCIEGEGVVPWALHVGGTDAASTAWASAAGDLVGHHYLSAAIDTWASGAGWIAFDVVKAGAGELVWFEHLDASGRPRVGFAEVGIPDVALAEDRDCSGPG
jgi:hypothetical protein